MINNLINLIRGIRHSITSGEWYTDLQFGLNMDDDQQSDFSAVNPDSRGLLIGTVLQIDSDPQSNERVLVNIPTLKSSEGIWARVLTLDAGEDRGWVFWPEVDDEVILGFLQDDPNYPVILGKLHSTKHNSPYPAESENAKKGYKSRSGMELIFDDKEKSIMLKSPHGNIMKLSDEDEGLVVTDQHDNAIILHKEGIILTSSKDLVVKAKGEVKISGQKVSVKADMEAKVEAKSGLSLSCNAMTELKGNIVKIN